jgi:hypothetical protein
MTANKQSSMHSKLAYPTLLFAAICLAATGCGDGRPARVPVAGQVLIDGKPLTRGYVRFVPAEGRPSTGNLDADGRFTLTCFETGDGALVGTHRVEVNGQQAIDDRQMKWHAPKKYATVTTSGLTQQIESPTDSLQINLSWDGAPGPFVEIVE